MKKKLGSVKKTKTASQEPLNQICQSLDQLHSEIGELHANQVNNRIDMANLIGQQVERLSLRESRRGKQPLEDDLPSSLPIHRSRSQTLKPTGGHCHVMHTSQSFQTSPIHTTAPPIIHHSMHNFEGSHRGDVYD